MATTIVSELLVLKGQPHQAAIATILFKDKLEQLGR